jgi:hypothetical protein
MRRMSLNGRPLMLDRTGSYDPNPESSQSVMVAPIGSETRAEIPTDSRIASITMIQVERTDRIFVHSDVNVDHTPGSVLATWPYVVEVILITSFS